MWHFFYFCFSDSFFFLWICIFTNADSFSVWIIFKCRTWMIMNLKSNSIRMPVSLFEIFSYLWIWIRSFWIAILKIRNISRLNHYSGIWILFLRMLSYEWHILLSGNTCHCTHSFCNILLSILRTFLSTFCFHTCSVSAISFIYSYTFCTYIDQIFYPLIGFFSRLSLTASVLYVLCTFCTFCTFCTL